MPDSCIDTCILKNQLTRLIILVQVITFRDRNGNPISGPIL